MVKTEFVWADGAEHDVKLSGAWNGWMPVQVSHCVGRIPIPLFRASRRAFPTWIGGEIEGHHFTPFLQSAPLFFVF